ncbi:hydroxysteroid 11-beta-dehydrogenase 1-like protein isoform X10 [Mustela lutreola]|uniref:hydroxysteroid 11-beta-dehydrogenase 1-like protein isoform X10 n=1 Tax=Mustela lutreola TaxID=9666 RepID=UPI0027973746|nr:hydroxysteroid 11-beta-dehydrogenase 1-like protein isoform X10 [Mustela lutreola]XP_059015595.1 hydroxysteroid 11-beta-dehydrogenase 1-like protein isoform X10 [Mustela lutreola]XP_059015596.1 hydroxysteroid 11-beta-dehydrogenase 1-like protein isoform X10 [Mustela lutreola]XP_059015597.1 hydroxysteroid 11-beta-dehydrogenase 1-like protein isoform X10 [Mustela lutreola]
MTTSTLPPGSPSAADRSQRRRWGGAGLSLRPPGLPPGAHGPHGGPPAEGGGELPEAGRSQGLLHRCGHGLPRGGLDYLVLNHLGATPAGTRSRSVQATRWLLQVRPLLGPAHHRQAPPPRAAVCPRGRDSQSPPPPGELPELRAADFVGAAQPDGQQRLSGGRVLAARPCAHILLQPVLGGQVRAGRLLRLSPAGAGRAGRERGHHHVRPGPPGSRLDRRGSQGRLEGQGGPRAQGSPGGDPRWRHPRPGRLLPLALPPALSAAGMAAAPEGLVHPPGAQCLRCRCCLSSRGWPSSFQRGTLHPAAPER